MKKAWLLLFILVVVFGFSGSAGASLTLIGTATYNNTPYKLIYDADGPFGPVTWLDYSRAGDTWQNQLDWTAGLGSNLTVTLDPLYVTDIDWKTGWRLPKTVDGTYNWPDDWGYDGSTIAGYNITSSEMGHLFYEGLGNKGYYDLNGNYPQSGWGLKNRGDFDNLTTTNQYWSGTENTANDAWYFYFYNGHQKPDWKGVPRSALAVRPGEVSAVPLPAAVWLLGSGLIGLVGFRKKFRKS